MLGFLVDNILAAFAGKNFHKIVGVPMGTNCTPLVADIFPAGNAYLSGHLVPYPHFRTCLCSDCFKTRFLELAISLLDFSPRIPLGTFSILLCTHTKRNSYRLYSRLESHSKQHSATSHIDTSMTYMYYPLIIKTLRIIGVGCSCSKHDGEQSFFLILEFLFLIGKSALHFAINVTI